MGRKARKEDEGASVRRISVRFSEEEYKQLTKDRGNMSLSDYFRKKLFK